MRLLRWDLQGDLEPERLDPNRFIRPDRVERNLCLDHWLGIRFHQSPEEHEKFGDVRVLVH